MTQERIEKLKQFYILDDSLNLGYTLDDITFNDLKLNDVFERIDRTVSSLGEEVLYGMLRSPALNIEDYNNRLDNIHYYEDNPSKAKAVKNTLKDLNKLKKVSCFEYLEHITLAHKLSTFNLFLPCILMLIAAMCMCINVTIGIVLVVGVYFYNAISYFKKRDKIAPYFISLSYISRAIRIGMHIEGMNTAKYKPIAFLKNASFLIGMINGETVNGGSGNPLDVLLDLIKMGLHVDIIRFYSLIGRIASNKALIFDFLKTLGYMDAYVAIAEFRTNCGLYCEPQFVIEGDNFLSIEDGVYLLNDNPRPNTIDTDKSVLLTGSNASGKSTFLRMTGLNAVLGQGICTCLAKSYKAPIYRIVSSMSVTDDVLKGDSFYMAEIKSLKRIIDLANSDNKVLCFVDEVLKGTNTAERISASSALLRKLSKTTLCFAATHDIELTDMLKDDYENYHFNEQMSGEDIAFDYTLKSGPSDTRNAIKLLEIMHFDRDIIEEARKNYERFGL